MKFSFIDQVEENTRYNLTFPFHIKHDELLGNDYYNPDYPDTYHSHSFESVLEKAYREPKAFYLTEEDKEYYSKQEITLIEKLIEDETKKVNNDYKIVQLNLTEESIDFLNKYKEEKDLTFEEAIIEIIKEMIENQDFLKEE